VAEFIGRRIRDGHGTQPQPVAGRILRDANVDRARAHILAHRQGDGGRRHDLKRLPAAGAKRDGRGLARTGPLDRHGHRGLVGAERAACGSDAHLHRPQQISTLVSLLNAHHVQRERIEFADGLRKPILEEEQRERIEPAVELSARHAGRAIGHGGFEPLERRGELRLADGRARSGLRAGHGCAACQRHRADPSRTAHDAGALIAESARSAASRAVA